MGADMGAVVPLQDVAQHQLVLARRWGHSLAPYTDSTQEIDLKMVNTLQRQVDLIFCF